MFNQNQSKSEPCMTSILPLCCSPAAYQLLSQQLATIDSPDSLLQSACAVAMHQHPGLNPASVDETIQRYADTIRGRVHGRQSQALLAHLHEFLFVEEGFVGNTADYYSPNNSYLSTVLETKVGLPITLSMVYQMVAQRLGFRTWGVGLPGHFLCAIEVDGQMMLVDAFAGGRILTGQEAHQRMEQIFGSDVEWSNELLRPASNRHWLTRMLQNLLNVFSAAGQYADVAAMLEMEILLWPEQTRLQRDLALVLARIGMAQPASAWLGKYLDGHPDDPQTEDLKQLLEVLTA
jgi:regulator of sirC expression with transglutaminase-like and TPR domain